MHALPGLREMMRALVAIPSVSSADARFDQGNRDVIDRLASWLEPLGFRIEVVPVSASGHKADLIATLGTGEGGLALAGHTDTVPWDPGRWTTDPFTLTEREGHLYGLGTADMKGFFAVALDAIRQLDPRTLSVPLTIVATADEESTMAGAEALSALGRPRARWVVIGEPTGLVPVRMHKGVSLQRLVLRGRSGHSSDPTGGASALDGMHAVLSALYELRAELATRHPHPGFVPPYPTLNVGAIHGGDSANRICGECVLAFDMRPVPGMDLAVVRAALRERVERAVAGRGLELELSFETGVPPFETSVTSEIVRVTEELTGHEAGSVAFGTEGPFFQRLGADTVVLGPGDISVAHQPDEHVSIAELARATGLVRELVARKCTERGSA